MNRTIITMILAATTATGCVTDPMIDGIGTALEPLEGTNGSSGNNGLEVTKFQAKSMELRELMGAGIFTNATDHIPKLSVSNFLATADGRDVFDYAVQCALNANDSFTHNNVPYTGKGILTTTTQWGVNALSTAAKEDLFACIVAHLNPLEQDSVPIFLSGTAVGPDMWSTRYPVKEALWTASVTEVGVTYHVWPLFPLPTMCAANPFDALNRRVCGHDAPACSLMPHESTAQDCILTTPGDDGHVTCLGKRAIMTRLTSTSFLSHLYPDCYPSPM